MKKVKETSSLTITEIWELIQFARKYSDYGLDFEGLIKLMDRKIVEVK
ncbi:hypothetical protein ACQKMN_16995 [Ureibacillus composti]